LLYEVQIELRETSQPLVYRGVENVYTKGPLLCVLFIGGMVIKFPLANVWRVTETASET
jgi:hypothetical protein